MRAVICKEMKKALFIICIAWALVGCSRQAPAPHVESSLGPEFESQFDRLFLSQEPLRYQDNVQFLSSIQKGKLNPKEIDLVRSRLKAFLQSNQSGRKYAPDSELTGRAPPLAFLKVKSVFLLGNIGTQADIPFIENLDDNASGFPPDAFKRARREAVDKIRNR
jgi:hypothetical protein